MKSLFFDSLKGQIDKFISVDGTGLGITHIGVGSNRYKVTFKGPGGHSYGAFGMANPIQAMGRAIAKIDAFEVPASPRPLSTWAAWAAARRSMPFPSRPGWRWTCARPTRVASRLSIRKFNAAIKEAVEEENARWNNRGPVTASAELVGVRPAGQTPKDSPIVQTAMAVSRALQIEEVLREGSTDSNVPMNLGIPAITISGGGTGTGAHSLNETFDTQGFLARHPAGHAAGHRAGALSLAGLLRAEDRAPDYLVGFHLVIKILARPHKDAHVRFQRIGIHQLAVGQVARVLAQQYGQLAPSRVRRIRRWLLRRKTTPEYVMFPARIAAPLWGRTRAACRASGDGEAVEVGSRESCGHSAAGSRRRSPRALPTFSTTTRRAGSIRRSSRST